MEDSLIIQDEENESEKGLLPGILWLLKGFVFPCWSRIFYKKASQKRVLIAVLFLLIFAFVQTSITTVQVAIAMNNIGGELKGAYEREELPSIIIEDGVARVDGQQQYISSFERTILAIDTTGNSQGIDTKLYSQGTLLTHNEIHFVDETGYQVIPLSELNEIFGNPIVLDKTQVLELWNNIALIINIAAFFGVYIWNTLVRIAYIALLGLLVWGVVSRKHKEVGFSQILITGIYANVPTIYLMFLLKKIGISFCSLDIILLIIIWAFAMRIVLKAEDIDLEVVDSETLQI